MHLLKNCKKIYHIVVSKLEQYDPSKAFFSRPYIDAPYKMDEYTITKSELEYLADKVNRLKELTDRICREKIQSIGLETSP